jgi:flagellar motor switch protein FliM
LLRRELSQDEIDAVFQGKRTDAQPTPEQTFDFQHVDRIPKSQLRHLRVLNETFVRNVSSSLSAYLRSYVNATSISLEQLTYSEFIELLPVPTCMVCLGVKPYSARAMLEMNPALTFTILEMLLGGTGKGQTKLERGLTEIEQLVIGGAVHIILKDLEAAWRNIAALEFTVEALETEPQLVHLLEPSEGVLATAIEVRIGDAVAIMNIAMPSMIVKMLRSKLDQQWSVRKQEATENDQRRTLRLIRPALVELEARVAVVTISGEELANLSAGDLLVLDVPLERPLEVRVNGVEKFAAEIVTTARKRAILIKDLIASCPPEPGDQGTPA